MKVLAVVTHSADKRDFASCFTVLGREVLGYSLSGHGCGQTRGPGSLGLGGLLTARPQAGMSKHTLEA